MSGVAAREKTLTNRACDWLRERDRAADKYDRTRRLPAVLGEHGGRDWGHRLMALVGRDDCGNWGPPRVRDLYLRDEWTYPPIDPDESIDVAKHAGVHHVQVTRDAMTAWDGVKRGETWRSFDSQDDGTTIRVGYLGDDGRLHDSGITGRSELARFRRWLIWDGWVKAEGLGLRRWLYYKGLHAAVEHRRPWACQITPPEHSGGYRHWHCDVPLTWREWLRARLWPHARPRHAGPHRFVNYTWAEGDEHVDYDPLPSTGHSR